MWGQVIQQSKSLPHPGIIPMRVGTRCEMPYNYTLKRDHPHACGDKFTNNTWIANTIGSSPCVWGQEKASTNVNLSRGIIPMRVGTSVLNLLYVSSRSDHPHACGDKRPRRTRAPQATGSSPCVWGQAQQLSNIFTSLGIIPMRVGTSCVFFKDEVMG